MTRRQENEIRDSVHPVDPVDEDGVAEATATLHVSASRDVGDREFRRGEAVGRYFILEPLGRGGMGVVLAAYDPELDRKVAIKLLHAGSPGSGSSGARLRLQREARAMAKLSHPNVVTVHDVGLFEGEVFVAMEFVRGRTLGGWCRDNDGTTWREIVTTFLQAGTGLLAAHEKGLVHRDFKPDNVLVSRDGSVKVTDFGLARAARPLEDDVDEYATSHGDDSSLPSRFPGYLRPGDDLLQTPVTEHGAVVGTPAYLPPEAYGDEGHLDARSDQFAFCIALWDALFGSKPYVGPTYAAMLAAMAQGKIQEPASSHDVPPKVIEILRRGLQPLPEDRWSSMGELLDALRREAEPDTPRRSSWRAASWIGLVLMLVVAGLLWRDHRANLCTDVDEPLADVWNDERRQQLVEMASSVSGPGAEKLAERLVSTLDAWADDWSATRVDACRATRIRGDQSEEMLDLRIVCLDRKLADMDAFLALLTAEGQQMSEGAARAVPGVARLALCSDTVALAAPVPPPEDASRESVEALQQRLGEAEAQLLLGQPVIAKDAALELEIEARDLGYSPLVAEAADLANRALLQTGEFEAGHDAAHRALSAALEGHDEYRLVASMIQIMSLEGSVFGDFAAAQRWYEHATKALGRVGNSRTQLESRLVHAWGGVLYGQGDFPGSLEAFRRSLELNVASDGPESPDSLAAANNIVVLLYSLGRIQESYDRLLQVREDMEAALGAKHPHLTYVQNNLAEAASRLGRPETCLEHGRAGLELATEIFGTHGPLHANAMNNVGLCLSALGRYDEALEHHDKVREIVEASVGELPQRTVAALGRARALAGLGRLQAATDAAQEAVDVGRRASEGATGVSEQWLEALLTSSRVHRAAQRPQAAVEASQSALDLLREAGRDQEPSAAAAFVEHGEALLARGEPGAAAKSFEEALTRLRPEGEDLTAQDPLVTARARLGLARALYDVAADSDRVPELLDRARSFYRDREGLEAQEALRQIDRLEQAAAR